MTSGVGDRPWLQGTDQPLAVVHDVALLDLDGVVYVGPEPVDGAADALARARAQGMRLAFVTNNASRSPDDVARHLVELGIPATTDDVVTSAQAAAAVIVAEVGTGASVLVTGSPALRQVVEAAGLRAVSSADDRPDAVVQGFWSELCYADLAEAALAVRAGAFWVATNADSTLPSSRGLLPGNGSLVGVVRAAAGKNPVVAGKPELPLHAEGVRRMAAENPLVVGDRLDTDIEGAHRANTSSLLVLTGVTTASDLLTARPEHRPTFLGEGLAALLEAQPAVVLDDDGSARCGEAIVHSRGGQLMIDGDDAPGIEALRALLALVWSMDDAGQRYEGAPKLLADLGWH
ncbi:MAG: HAD-IIA family hydrolase [Acidothermaceae bacterium]